MIVTIIIIIIRWSVWYWPHRRTSQAISSRLLIRYLVVGCWYFVFANWHYLIGIWSLVIGSVYTYWHCYWFGNWYSEIIIFELVLGEKKSEIIRSWTSSKLQAVQTFFLQSLMQVTRKITILVNLCSCDTENHDLGELIILLQSERGTGTRLQLIC